MKNRASERGFTLIEALVVVGIMGALMALSYPSIMNSLESRNLDNSTRDIQTTLQQARYMAVNEKVFCRARFFQESNEWKIILETQDPAGNWDAVPSFLKQTISRRFILSLNLPAGLTVEFSPVGVVESYDSTHNSLTLQSLKLKSGRQPDLRVLTIFGGGTIRYVRMASS